MRTVARLNVLGTEWTPPDANARRSILRHSPRDAALLGVAGLQGALVACAFALTDFLQQGGGLMFAALFGVSSCWSSNTVSHNHLHQPLFRVKSLNVALSWLLTLSIGVPQSLWRARHFWHHAGEPPRSRPRVVSLGIAAEAGAILALWGGLLAHAPRVLLTAYLPGYVLGLLLSQLQGKMEHRATRSSTAGVSHYGRLYNFAWFNDGYHAEHHRFPSEHWTRLPARRQQCARAESAWPPLLRWLERPGGVPGARQGRVLGLLEQIALRSSLVRDFMVASHERAFRSLLSDGRIRANRVAIIGGGLFPRTALVLGRIFPESTLTIIDHSRDNLRIAREFLARRGLGGVNLRFEHAAFAPQLAAVHDIVVVPLAYVGDPSILRKVHPRCRLVVHEWLWQHSSADSVVISWFLLKRLSLLEERREND